MVTSSNDDFLDRLLEVGFEQRPALPISSPSRAPFDDESALLQHPTLKALGEEGRYRIDGLLGRGGMGLVVRAHDGQLDREVAIKVVRVDDSVLIDRFQEEARIAARLQHPGILPVYEVGSVSRNHPYFTMKVVQGRTLASLLESLTQSGDRSRLLGVVRRVAEAVAYAHARGIVHGDLKPSNILLGDFGETFVMDWGLARSIVSRVDATDTASWPAGTPSYLAPEQARGGIDAARPTADVFALGAILFQVLTGRTLFDGLDSGQRWRAAANGELGPAHLRLSACVVDTDLRTFVRSCLEADPIRRPADANEVAAHLAAYRQRIDEQLRSAELALVAAKVRARQSTLVRWLLVGTIVCGASLVVLGAISMRDAQERALVLERQTANAQAGLEVAAGEAEAALELPPTTDEVLARRGLERGRRRLTEALVAGRELPVDAGALQAAEATMVRIDSSLQRMADAQRIREMDRATLERLAAIRDDEQTHRSFHARDAAYERAFAEYGVSLDSDALPLTVQRIRESAIRDGLLAGLDDWTLARVGSNQSVVDDRARAIMRLSAVADPNARRGELRERLRLDPVACLPAALEEIVELPASALHLVGDDLRLRGRADLARTLYRAAVARHPESHWLHLGLGYLLSLGTSEDLEESLLHFVRARALAPRRGTAAINAGVVARRLDRWNLAEAFLLSGLENFPTSVTGRITLGAAYKDVGRYAAAAEQFALARVESPDDLSLLLAVVDAWQRADRSEAALAALEGAGRFRDEDVVLALHGESLLRAGRRDEGRAVLLELTGSDRATAAAWSGLAWMHASEGHPEQALIAAREAQRRAPKAAIFMDRLGDLLVDSESPEGVREGVRWLRGPTDEVRRSQQALAALVRGRRKLGEFQAALATVQRQLEELPEGKERESALSIASSLRKEVEVDDLLIGALNGTREPTDSAQWRSLVTFCSYRRLHHREARLWEQAFARRPLPLDDAAGRAHAHAARCVVRWLDGASMDGGGWDGAARVRWTSLAVEWFETATLRLEHAGGEPGVPESVRRELAARWNRGDDHASLRNAVDDPALPVDVRRRLREAIARVAALDRQ